MRCSMWQCTRTSAPETHTHMVMRSTGVMHTFPLKTDGSESEHRGKVLAQSPPQLPPTLASAPLTAEGEVAKGHCKPIHAEHGPNGHTGHSLHSALGGPELEKS